MLILKNVFVLSFVSPVYKKKVISGLFACQTSASGNVGLDPGKWFFGYHGGHDSSTAIAHSRKNDDLDYLQFYS